jgi:hypothetical protein
VLDASNPAFKVERYCRGCIRKARELESSDCVDGHNGDLPSSLARSGRVHLIFSQKCDCVRMTQFEGVRLPFFVSSAESR